AARAILGRLGCGSVLITRGERGLMLLSEGGEPTYVPTAAREVFDVTGAGDTVIATLAGAMAAGATLVEASVLANHAAGVVVGKLGTATASTVELLASASNESLDCLPNARAHRLSTSEHGAPTRNLLTL
ncbi:MAG: PfkB family carbohydrate kinase, partial [Pyrinomonadaceae bacterium]